MNNEMALWGEGFRKHYPDVKIEVEGKGSTTAPPALIAGTAQFGPMSRDMKSKEMDEFEAKFGYKPTGLATSLDMLAVYVHKDNPLKGLTLQQVDAVFSKSRKGGFEKDIVKWGDLGLTGEWADKPISLYGRNSASGTYGYFKEHALFKGDYKDSVKEQAGSSAVVQAVASDRYAMGYSGIGYKTADVLAVPLAPKAGQPFIAATPDNAYSGEYPMARFLWLYVNHRPGSELDPLRREFIRYVMSREGQLDVVKDGYFPLTAGLAKEQLARVGLQAGAVPAEQVSVDKSLPSYKPVGGVSGSIKSVGSDTMNNEMALWGEGFRKHYPDVKIEVEGKGSTTAPPALIAGTAQFGPMSRDMKSKEMDEFEAKFGYKPTGLATSLDMLAVYVHKDNPLKGLTLQQVDAVFSKSRKGGFEKDIVKWGDLGLTGEWADKPISLYGRNSASGTYGYFKEHALFKGDYKDSVKEQAGSSAVVQAVASDRYAMGYSGIGYKTADVLAVPLAPKAGQPFIAATPDNAYSGEYPMARFLWLYVNHRPGSELDPLRREFIRYVMSREGQLDVVKDGYFPLTAGLAKEQLARVGL